MRYIARFVLWPVFWLAMLVLMTVLTQVGGIAMLLTWIAARLMPRSWRGRPWRRRGAKLATFAATYAVIAIFAVPPLAALYGRVPLQCIATDDLPYGALSVFYCATNRHYVQPPLDEVTAALAHHMDQAFPGTVVQYLDGGFPFDVSRLQMPPHFTHGDGRRLDIAFFYQNEDGAYERGLARWWLGYFAVEEARPGERLPCSAERLADRRLDIGWFQDIVADHPVDVPRTAEMIRWLVNEGTQLGVTRLLLEPHLAERWDISGPAMGHHGCWSARHDDHIHVDVY